MKKKLTQRILFGIPAGIAISHLITLAISLGWGKGAFWPCVPGLVEAIGAESGAVALQTGLSALLGAAFAALSLIWEVDRWSIAKQTGLYFLAASLAMLPVAYFARWMEHTIAGFLLYFGIFTGIFVIVWIAQFLIWKKKIRSFNERMGERGEK